MKHTRSKRTPRYNKTIKKKIQADHPHFIERFNHIKYLKHQEHKDHI